MGDGFGFRWVAAFVAVLGWYFAPLVALAQSQESGTIVVTVTDAATRKPIDNADVFLLGGDQPQNSLTNAKGLLIFDGLQPAIYRVKVQADGYVASSSTDVEVGEGQRVDVAVKLTLRLRTIASVVARSTTSVSVERVDQQSAQWKVSQSLSDALNRIAGVTADTNDYGGDSAFNISLRGADPSRTSYSIDGMHVGGSAGSAIAGFQDLFSGSSVDFAPSAASTAGNVNFYTIQPTKLWSYSFSGLIGNYGKTAGAWTVTGGAGKAAFAFEHASGGQDSPLDGMFYADQSGSAYTHEGGYARTEDLFKMSLVLSPVSNLKYTLMTGTNRSSAICAQDTALLPCNDGRGNWTHGNNTLHALNFSSLAGHLQYNLGVNHWRFQYTSADPNLTINGMALPSYNSGTYPTTSFFANVSATARRHTISGGMYESVFNGTDTSTYNSTQTISNVRTEHSGAIWITNRVKSNDKLAIDTTLSQASGSGAGNSLQLYENVTWQPKAADVFEAGLGMGSADPSRGAGTIGDAASAQYDCGNGSVFVNGPPDEAVKQSSLQYNLDWRHSLKGGFIKASLYRSDLGGQSLRAGVPFDAEPPSLFPGGPAAYLSQLESIWSQATVCGSTPFDPTHVYISQNIAGVNQVQQGVDLSAQIPLGRNVIALPRYAVTNSYISSLDPRLTGAGSYYAVGAQLPHVPLHTAGLIIDGRLNRWGTEWLLDAEFTSANNGNNLPAHTIYNAGLLLPMHYGTIRLLEANVFGKDTGLFTTYEGINPMPLQGGGTFAYATTPLPPRSFTVQYQVRWHARQQAARPNLPKPARR